MPRPFQCVLLTCVVLIPSAFGCNRSSQKDANEQVSSQANEPKPQEFESLLEKSNAELQHKTEANKAWGLGTFDRWAIDQKTGDLVFSNEDGTTAVAPAQMIGSFSTKDNSWLWAWDNPTIVDALKRDSLKLKAYGEQHNIENLTTPRWTGTQEDAWAMTALAVKLCDAQGAYRGPSGSSYVFMTFGEVRITASSEETKSKKQN